jgi:hypothetical protein
VKAKLFPGLSVVATALALLAAGCSKEGRAAPQDQGHEAPGANSAPSGDCGHTACGSNFFLDAVAPADCAAGAKCTLSVKLVATGDFHINEDYPYKFKADDTPGVDYLGADTAGNNVFSKGASDWQKKDEKSGIMTVAFRPTDRGQKTVGGTFKLSVCSAQTCQLEQQPLKAAVTVH